ncbi:hypothetical protein ACPXAU_24925, partial [Salmonella enterica]
MISHDVVSALPRKCCVCRVVRLPAAGVKLVCCCTAAVLLLYWCSLATVLPSPCYCTGGFPQLS